MNDSPASAPAVAYVGGRLARNVVDFADLTHDSAKVIAGGFWVVVGDFDGPVRAWRFADVTDMPLADAVAEYGRDNPAVVAWEGPAPASWTTSLDREQYMAGVARIRGDIRNGTVYQVNLCRMLSAPLSGSVEAPSAMALHARVSAGNPAPFGAAVQIPPSPGVPGTWVVSASPELYLRLDGRVIESSPIKGTAAPGEPMLPKDEAENVMITDLVRNDMSHVAVPGSVTVPEFLGLRSHPGLNHLQSTVRARLDAPWDWTAQMWPALLDGTFPPGSVSGAPKSSALDIIRREETTARGPYCGTIGWIDADARRAELAVGIRTFAWERSGGGTLRFGTGAGITWGSDPDAEWNETELKARRLIALANADTMTS